MSGRDPNQTRSVMLPDTVRANYERIRSELGSDVTIVAATKYVDV